MTHWTPQTQASEDKCVAPFYAQDDRIQGIRASHWWSGSCTHDYGSATIAAIVGPLRPGAEERASTFSREDEVMTPAYYAVTLPDHGVRVEVTGTARGAILRFTFLRRGEASFLVHANRKTRGAIPGGLARVDAARRAIAIGSPLFEEARIDVGGGRTFTVRAPGASASNLYVQSATLDGRPHPRPWIAHADVARGATLELRLGPRPNRAWGARPEDAPPSLSRVR